MIYIYMNDIVCEFFGIVVFNFDFINMMMVDIFSLIDVRSF